MAKLKQKNNEMSWLKITITVIVVIWFAMIIVVRVYQNRDSGPPPFDSRVALSEEEKQRLLQDLVKQETSKLSKAQKEKIVQAVAKSGKNNLTVEEKKYILEQLTK